MFYRVRSTTIKIIASILALVTDQIDSFKLHYYGPDLSFAIEDFSNWLKWQYKADKRPDPYDVREKLYEFLNERGVDL